MNRLSDAELFFGLKVIYLSRPFSDWTELTFTFAKGGFNNFVRRMNTDEITSQPIFRV